MKQEILCEKCGGELMKEMMEFIYIPSGTDDFDSVAICKNDCEASMK